MDHIIFFLYVIALALGCGACALVLLAWYRYRTDVWALYTAIIASVSVLVILDMLAVYRTAAGIPLSMLTVVRPFIGIPAQTMIVVLLVIMAHAIASLSLSRPFVAVYSALLALYAAGNIVNACIVNAALSVTMDISFAIIIGYAACIIGLRFSSIQSDLLRALVISVGIPTILTVAGAAILAFLPYRTLHYALFTGYYSVLSILTVIHAVRYLSRGDAIRENAAALREKEDTPLARLFARVALTGREREILSFIASGYTNGAIAERMGISHQTVKNYVFNAYQKFGIRTRNEFIELVLSGTDTPPKA